MRTRTYVLWTLSGFLLLQAVWILTVPPFRGIDEFDHAFRAAGAASGQVRVAEEAENGRGMLVSATPELVRAASAQCEWLDYTGPDNCHAVVTLPDGRVSVASSAGLYNPAWYTVVGLPTRFLDGVPALYGMRVLAALICAVGVGLSALSLSMLNPGRWTKFAFLAALTPVLVYSTVLPGPNGPEIVAGLLLWTALMAIFSPRAMPGREAFFLFLATAAAAALSLMRTLGPMWLGLIVLSVVLAYGFRHILDVVGRRPVHWVLASIVVVAGAVAGSAWTLGAGLTGTSPDVANASEAPGEFTVGTKPIAWSLQMIAAFPLRRETAPPVVYMCGVLTIGFVILAGWAVAKGRARWAIGAFAFATVALPVVLTALTYDTQGSIWQGRYQLPWAVGLLLLCGEVLDERGFLRREGTRPYWVAGALLAAGQAWSVWGVASREWRQEVSRADPNWITLPPAALGGLAVVAIALMLWPIMLSTRSSSSGQTQAMSVEVAS